MAELRALSLPEALREFRERRGLSKRALSQKAGLSASYVGKLEDEGIEPSVRAFAVIVLALELTPYETLFLIRCALAESRSEKERGLRISRLVADDQELAERKKAV